MPTALVTGSSSGIGLEIARILAARGHDLVLVARSGKRLEEIASELRDTHKIAVTTFAADLAVPGAARGVNDFTTERKLDIGLLINNAGVGMVGAHVELPAAEILRMLQLNVIALTELCQLYAVPMKARRAGRILNVASTAAYQPTPFFAAYGASKAYVLSFSEALAKELEDFGVSVSCLSPGPTDTGFFSEVDASGVKKAHFDERANARTVAALGVKILFSGKLSQIAGRKNALRAFAARLAPRSMVAKISKGVMTAEGKP